MTVLNIVVVEKWSRNPVPLADVYINGYKFRADEYGKLSVNAPAGGIEIKAVKQGYEDALVSLSLVADSQFTVIMTPHFQALV